ncbi:basic amino acid/polyamine antiporter, APA family [Anaerosphaera aminiphila DSM 21120]|uniref:Basic amino acid/polyamine antiporter, APA family n=1 Tax=Anaerosphaera aminiphila DSM 21120 TaxID=1120995 RepID=A0A1M5R6K2_9FIRM|nr:APC family permease [Anaerosphaera aminiphila]SHH21987.1 basic amino acid/polyamine antiporter, APA family [Anaerosphaera aminiphila DSM 21120]
MEKNKTTYGLPTAIAMIVGIVIGSGIFFKADDILIATGGNVKLGLLVLLIGATAIIFGSLSLSEFAFRSTSTGGFVGYFEEFISSKTASGFGYFQTFIYYPSIAVVVSWASIIFGSMIFNVSLSLEVQLLIAYLLLITLIFTNTVSKRLGGYFQNVSTVIKLIPLFTIAIVGIFFKGSPPEIPQGVPLVLPKSVGISWITSLAPIAFSFDGWPIATSISQEVKNPQKTMPKALVTAPILILISYLLYFYGITKICGPTYIMTMQDYSVYKVSELIFGDLGAKIMITFITIAIMGVVNGVLLGGIRMPQALAEKNICFNKSVAKVDEKYGLSIKSSIIFALICTVWMFIHYITQKLNLLNERDVSEIAIVFGNAVNILLYLKVLNFYKSGEIESKLRGLIAPIFAIIGSLIILFGGIISSPLYIGVYLIVCLLVFLLGFYKNK